VSHEQASEKTQLLKLDLRAFSGL